MKAAKKSANPKEFFNKQDTGFISECIKAFNFEVNNK